MNTKEIRAIIEEQKAAQAKYNEEIEKLNSGMYSKEYIASEKTKLNGSYGADKSARGKKTADALLDYKKQIHGSLDLSDPALSNFIGLTTAMGKSTPRSVLDSAVEHFKGNNTALKAISSIIHQHEIPYATVDRFIVDEEALDAAILSAQSDLDRNNGLSPLGLLLDHLDEVEAYQIEPEPVIPSNIPQIF